ncbi:NDR1/HIN1-like protein 10 [Phoenix dactylifera]|uniref:NDR1/HIN1-like protein 10 n=1 Tax=Phoenix dactylifera TaxID=42345 RepID=A0A8B7CZE9_PHODC|nr:NDR1/HIN1-like protein 10 [Phoenix dactylifera]
MGDRPYLSANPNASSARTLTGVGATVGGGAGGPLPFPANKARRYGDTHPAYCKHLPPPAGPRRRRHGRGCCCACCLWLTLLLISLVFLAAIAAGVFYVIDNPQRLSFSVHSVRLSALNLTSSDLLTSQLDIAVSARNPNRNLVFLYDHISIYVYSDGVEIGKGSFPAFVQGTENTTVLNATVSSSGRSLDPGEAADLRKRNKFPLEIELETKAGVKIGGFKSKRIGLTVSCDGIEVGVAKGKAAATATSQANARCHAKLRIKFWKWTF